MALAVILPYLALVQGSTKLCLSLKYHKLMNDRNVLLTILEAGKSKIKWPAWMCFDEGPLPVIAGNFSLCPQGVGGARDLSRASSERP